MNGERRTIYSILVRAALLYCMGIVPLTSTGQALDRRWVGGYQSGGGAPYGGNKTIFPASDPGWSLEESRPMWFSSTVAVFTDANDSIAAYTNGVAVANRTGQTMLNGTGLNPSAYTTANSEFGLHLPNSHILIKIPDSDSLLALFHVTIDTLDDTGLVISRYLYLSVVDMSADDGLGAVVLKNEVLLSGEFCPSGLASVKHGNGRDWWIFFHANNNDVFIQYLLTPTGVEGPWFQSGGVIRHGYGPVISISRDGSELLIMDAGADLDIFDFDRCTGLLSNPRHATISDGMSSGQADFSPSGRFVYVTSVTRAYQYDLQAADLQSSQLIVAEWDGFFDTFDGLNTYFTNISNAPDGKIYISTGNATRYMHIIDEPDSLGAACNVLQHGHDRQTFTDNSIPYRPNYYLGPLAGSPCDTLGLGLPEHSPPLNVRVHPNPSSGVCTLSYAAQADAGLLEVRDLSGKLLITERIPQWSTVHTVALSAASAGMYQCTLTWPTHKSTTRIVIEP